MWPAPQCPRARAGTNRPARSRIVPKTLGSCGRGRHIHSIAPVGATRQRVLTVREEGVVGDRREDRLDAVRIDAVWDGRSPRTRSEPARGCQRRQPGVNIELPGLAARLVYASAVDLPGTSPTKWFVTNSFTDSPHRQPQPRITGPYRRIRHQTTSLGGSRTTRCPGDHRWGRARSVRLRLWSSDHDGSPENERHSFTSRVCDRSGAIAQRDVSRRRPSGLEGDQDLLEAVNEVEVSLTIERFQH